MKILHIVSSYVPAYEMGGPIRSVHNLNKWLVKLGMDVTVYTTNAGLDDEYANKMKEIDGVKVHYFPYRGYIHFTFSPAMYRQIKKTVKDFDVVHATAIWNFPTWAASYWARKNKIPYIVSPRGSLMKSPLGRKSSLKKRIHLALAGKDILENAVAIHFTVGKEEEEYEKTGLSMKNSIVIPNGVDVSPPVRNPPSHKATEGRGASEGRVVNFREKYGISEDAKVVLFLGRLHAIKGLDTLLPAFGKAVEKETRNPPAPRLRRAGKEQGTKLVLVIAGPDEGGYVHEIKKTIKQESKKGGVDLEDKIIFTGMVLDEEKEAVFAAADVFVLPSYSENFGMVVVEAMARELPVVISDKVGIAEDVKKAGAGMVTEKDEDQVAEAILSILNDKDRATEMGKRGHALVLDKYSNRSIAEKWLGAYKKVISN